MAGASALLLQQAQQQQSTKAQQIVQEQNSYIVLKPNSSIALSPNISIFLEPQRPERRRHAGALPSGEEEDCELPQSPCCSPLDPLTCPATVASSICKAAMRDLAPAATSPRNTERAQNHKTTSPQTKFPSAQQEQEGTRAEENSRNWKRERDGDDACPSAPYSTEKAHSHETTFLSAGGNSRHWKRESDGDGCCASCFAGLRERATKAASLLLRGGKKTENVSASAASSQTPVTSALTQEELTERSRSNLERHIREAAWSPTVCLYDASMDPPQKASTCRRRAYQLPVNGSSPCLIDNDTFRGHFLMLYETPDTDGDGSVPAKGPYDRFFQGKSRRWETRVQGQFKKHPAGELYTGCILEDFDYTVEPSWGVSVLASAVVPLMEAVMGQRFIFSWGTRGSVIPPEDEELATMVTSLAGCDQIIVTKAGDTPPSIEQDLTGLGLCRNAMSRQAFRDAAQEVSSTANTEDTYTFCIWGCSAYIDALKSSFNGLFGLASVSYEGFLDEWPAHFVLYSLPKDEKDSRHLEKKKTYFIDVMVWGSGMTVTKLPERYEFMDQRKTRQPAKLPRRM